jgi:Flp pilus assembly protein TadD
LFYCACFLLLACQLLPAADEVAANSLLQRGLVALQHGQIQQARKDLERASRENPKNPYVWSALAEVYAKAGEPKLAASSADTAQRIGGTNPVVSHVLGMFYSEIEKAAQQDPQVAFNWTQAFLEREDFARAAEIGQAGLTAHPNDAQLILASGVARYGQRRFEDAITAFLKVIEIDPAIPQPYLFLGRMLEQAGSHLDAITRDYERWVKREPQNPKGQLMLARALLATNSTDSRAEAALRKSIALDANDWESHYELGVLLAGKHEYAAAAEELNKSVALDPKQPMPHYHLARVYDRLGQPERAKAEREVHQKLTTSGNGATK